VDTDFVGEHQTNFRSFLADLCALFNDVGSVVCRLEGCITQVGHWMSANRVKLDTNKTELVWTGSRHNLSLLAWGCGPSVQLGDNLIKLSDHVRLLGVTIVVDLVLTGVSQMYTRHVSFGIGS